MADLIGRVKAILIEPKNEFPKTISEPGDLKSLLIPYVAILAALGPVANYISKGLIGERISIFGMTVVHRAPVAGLFMMILSFGLSIAAWWFYAFILSVLAPSFGGRKDMPGALKLAAYSITPIWVAGVLGLLTFLPFLGVLALLGMIGGLVYAILLGIWGAPTLLGTPEDKAVGHVLASIGITVVAYLIGAVIIGITYAMIAGAAMIGSGALR